MALSDCPFHDLGHLLYPDQKGAGGTHANSIGFLTHGAYGDHIVFCGSAYA